MEPALPPPITFFEELVAPLSPQTFLAEHWDKKPVHLQAKTRGRLDALRLPIAHLARWATDPEPLSRRAQFYNQDGRSIDIVFSTPQLEAMFDAGMTIQVTELQRTHPDLALLAGRLRQELTYAGRVACALFASPTGGGFPLHFDRTCVFSFQLEGSKRWRYSRAPAMPYPPLSYVDQSRESEERYALQYPWAKFTPAREMEFEEVVLERGDVLYLPPGCWHAPRAGSTSVAVTFGFVPMDFQRRLSHVLETQFVTHPEWRSGMPPVLSSTSRRDEQSRKRYVETRLRELASTVEGLRPEDFLDVDTEDEDDERVTLAPDDVISVVNHMQLKTDIDVDTDEDCVIVLSHARSVSMGIEALPFLQKLTTVERFIAREAMAWAGALDTYSWGEVEQALLGLLDAGLLRVEGR